MRILHVAPIAGDLEQGLSYSIPDLARAQSLYGHDVAILTSAAKPWRSLQAPFPCYWKGSLGRGANPTLDELVQNCDLIVMHSTYIPFHTKVAICARRNGVPYVLVPRGGMTLGASRIKPLKKALGNILFFNYLVRKSLAVHCLTAREAQASVRWGKQIFVAGNGIALPPHASAKEWNRPIKVVFIGRLSIQHKGIDLLLSGWAEFMRGQDGQIAVLELYGPDENGSRLKIEAMIRDKVISNSVRVYEPVFGEDKRRVLESADVFVHTSRFEGHPMSVLEALAYGLPCVLTPGTNLADEVEVSGAGVAVEESAASIAQGLSDLMDRRNHFSELSACAREFAEKNSWAVIAKETLEHYRRLLSIVDKKCE